MLTTKMLDLGKKPLELPGSGYFCIARASCGHNLPVSAFLTELLTPFRFSCGVDRVFGSPRYRFHASDFLGNGREGKGKETEKALSSKPHQLLLHILIPRGADKDRVLHQTNKAPESIRFIQNLSKDGGHEVRHSLGIANGRVVHCIVQQDPPKKRTIKRKKKKQKVRLGIMEVRGFRSSLPKEPLARSFF